ncbi:hypothetical protein [Paenibacillus illinoisensis]|uniref:hypothetical protein n=1 Tax=Paenibacillus illinoisensis TaxID=59845 RepID=UPI0015802987|nr:hypothetical protein [Paenibacillus illinoisensis]
MPQFPPTSVEGQEHGPIEVAILAAFLIYRYKFLSRAKDKNLYRFPEWTRTCSYCRLGVYLNGTAQDKAALDAEFDAVYNKFVKSGRAVVIGEMGTINKKQ